MHQRESRRHDKPEQAAPSCPPSWKELWRDLSVRKDGQVRAVPDAAEAMVMRIKQLEEEKPQGNPAPALRQVLQQYCGDAALLDESPEHNRLSPAEQRQVNEGWFAFRASRRSWDDVAQLVESCCDARAIVLVLAKELWIGREQYLFQPLDDRGGGERAPQEEVLRLLSESFSLLKGEEASIMVELAHELYRAKAIGEFDYAQKLSCYSKAPGASISECIRHLSRAREALPEKLHAETEAELLGLGEMLGLAIEKLKVPECVGLLEAPYPVTVGLAPAFIRKQAGDLPALYAVTALEQMCYQLEFAAGCMQRELLGRVASEVRDALVGAVRLLPPSDAQDLIETAAPVILSASWWSREAAPLWDLLTEADNFETAAIRTGLLKHVLRSPDLVNDLSTWIKSQVGYRWFQSRLEGLARALGGVLVERHESGEKAVPALEALQALRLIAELGGASMKAAPEVGALAGVPIMNVWLLGPVCLPWRMRRDESLAVFDAAYEALQVMAYHAPAAFGDALSRRLR